MRSMRHTFLTWWHQMLGLQRQTPRSWHCDRLREERQELNEAKTWLGKLSESSDFIFSISRARHDGYDIHPLPHFFDLRYTLPYIYMIWKFSSRCMFYRTAAFLYRAPHSVREVVNPTKDDKLYQVAIRHQLDPVQFKQICRRLLRVWPLPP